MLLLVLVWLRRERSCTFQSSVGNSGVDLNHLFLDSLPASMLLTSKLETSSIGIHSFYVNSISTSLTSASGRNASAVKYVIFSLKAWFFSYKYLCREMRNFSVYTSR